MIALTLLMAALYVWGVAIVWRHAGRGRGIRTSQCLCFATAIIVLLAASGPPLDSMSDALFSAHMIQHVLLATVAPPFLVLGAPELAIAWAVPRTVRIAIARGLLRQWWLRAVWRSFSAPVVATVVHGLAIWVWHAPSLYQLALRNEGAHTIEHLSFVVSALLLWRSIVHPRSSRRTGYAVGILTMFITAMHTGALGALFTLSRRVWYPAHIPLAAVWGTTALEDQQLAGLIMWVVGGLLYVVAMSALFVAWLRVSASRTGRASGSRMTKPSNAELKAAPFALAAVVSANDKAVAS